MERFFGIVNQDRALIEEDFHHLKVKRIKKGEHIEVIDKETFQPYLCEVETIEKRKALCKVLEPLPKNVPLVDITLLQCVPIKVSTLDEIIPPITQVGVSTLVPTISERSFQDTKVIERKIPRWEKIALESLKQCGRHQPLNIEKPLKLEQVKNYLPEEGLFLFPFEREKTLTLPKVLERVENPQKVFIVVGPEGGFSQKEAQLLEEIGFIPVSLGNFILKAETAAVVASALVYNLLVEKLKETQTI
jgi:16S rRNA (uracil1498-N3)-methyltransferase